MGIVGYTDADQCNNLYYPPTYFQGVVNDMENVILTKSESLRQWVQKTGNCSLVLLSSAETDIIYVEPVKCKVELVVHCSTMYHCLYGSHFIVCQSGDDAVCYLCFGLPHQCGERSCRDSVTCLLG